MLVSQKTQDLYIRALNRLKDLLSEYHLVPKYITCCYDLHLPEAMRTCFPSATFVPCFFQLAKAFWQSWLRAGLPLTLLAKVALYDLLTLAFVPERELQTQYSITCAKYAKYESTIGSFWQQFRSEWLVREQQLGYWHMHTMAQDSSAAKRLVVANSAIESYALDVNTSLSNRRPSTSEAISAIKAQEHYKRTEFDSYMESQGPQSMKLDPLLQHFLERTADGSFECYDYEEELYLNDLEFGYAETSLTRSKDHSRKLPDNATSVEFSASRSSRLKTELQEPARTTVKNDETIEPRSDVIDPTVHPTISS